MSYFNRNRILIIIIIILVIVNVISLATVWIQFKRPFLNRDFHGRGRFIERVLKNRLNFTDEQFNNFDKLRNKHHKETGRILEEIHREKKVLMEKTKSAQLDEDAINRQVQKLAELHTQHELSNFHHLKQVRELCSESQKVEFDRMVDRIFNHAHPKRWHGRGHGGRRRP
ncbi:MAG TPA: Spy/CpxP family protein refolding chaperone [Cyclobacteriaceae bacterium]